MSTYGVSYANPKNLRSWGVMGGRSLTRSPGVPQAPSMRPLSMQPIHPNGAGFQAINAPQPLDALARVLQGGQDTFSQIAPTPQAPTAPGSTVTKAPTASYQGTDLSADPILTQIKALGQRSAQDAASGELANAENALINYGDVNVPQTLRDFITGQQPSNDPLLGDLPSNPILGALNDEHTAQAASANPFSTVKQLAGAHDTNQHNIDQASNLANLYYSSTHANELGAENQNYLGAQSTALENLAALLSGQNNGLIDAINAAHQNYLNELPSAYARAIANGSGDPNAPPPPPPGGGSPPNYGGLSTGGANTSGLAALFQRLQQARLYGSGAGGGGGRTALG